MPRTVIKCPPSATGLSLGEAPCEWQNNFLLQLFIFKFRVLLTFISLRLQRSLAPFLESKTIFLWCAILSFVIFSPPRDARLNYPGMESLTPPLSSSSSEGRSPERYSFQPAKRPRTGHRRHGNSESGDFITLHEESSELEKTEHHFPNFQTFINKLDDAYKTKWATRSVPYQHVIALLVRWEEDDLGVHEEIQSLQEIFRDTYHFDVETWAIPSTKRGYISLIRKMEAILEQYDVEDNLFILYYGGHAYQDEQPQPTWVS